jgi:hypothetical protein
MMRKYLVILLSAGLLACLGVVAGVLVTAVATYGSAERTTSEVAWSLRPVAIRDEEEYRRAAEEFRRRYRWLVPEDPLPESQEAAVPPAETLKSAPSGPAWRFVGVLLEAGSARLALVAEGGKVNRYQEGAVFGDGTQLLAIGEQSLRISRAGSERDVHLYRPD